VELVIGVDFDNTIANYESSFHRVALQRDLISTGAKKTKEEIRDHVRQLPEGEMLWRGLQAAVYGPMMDQAELNIHAREFFKGCRQRDIGIYIVSHKTQFAESDTTGTNLRTAALAWMTRHSFFASGGLGLSPGRVFFESTRLEKLQRIQDLGCTVFIDDLPEIFSDSSFPAGVKKILYAPQGRTDANLGVMIAGCWKDISEYVFALAA
jgi:hypothetical protein